MSIELEATAIANYSSALSSYLTHASEDPRSDDADWLATLEQLRDRRADREMEAMIAGVDPGLLASPVSYMGNWHGVKVPFGWREARDLHVVCTAHGWSGYVLGSAPPAGWECWEDVTCRQSGVEVELYRPAGSDCRGYPTSWTTALDTMEERLDALRSDTEPT